VAPRLRQLRNLPRKTKVKAMRALWTLISRWWTTTNKFCFFRIDPGFDFFQPGVFSSPILLNSRF